MRHAHGDEILYEAIKRNSLQAKVETTIIRSQNVFPSKRKSFPSSSKKIKTQLGWKSLMFVWWLAFGLSFILSSDVLSFSYFHSLWISYYISISIFLLYFMFFLYVSVILFRIRDPLISISAHELTSMTSPQFHFTHHCPSWCLFRWWS